MSFLGEKALGGLLHYRIVGGDQSPLFLARRTARSEDENDGDRDTSKKSAGKNKTYIEEIHSGVTITVTPE